MRNINLLNINIYNKPFIKYFTCQSSLEYTSSRFWDFRVSWDEFNGSIRFQIQISVSKIVQKSIKSSITNRCYVKLVICIKKSPTAWRLSLFASRAWHNSVSKSKNSLFEPTGLPVCFHDEIEPSLPKLTQKIVHVWLILSHKYFFKDKWKPKII